MPVLKFGSEFLDVAGSQNTGGGGRKPFAG